MKEQEDKSKAIIKALSRIKTRKARMLVRDLTPAWRVMLSDFARFLLFTVLFDFASAAYANTPRHFISQENIWTFVPVLVFLWLIVSRNLFPAYDWFISRKNRERKVREWLEEKRLAHIADIQRSYPDLDKRFPGIYRQITTPCVFVSNSGDSGLVSSILGYHVINSKLETDFFPFSNSDIKYGLPYDDTGPTYRSLRLWAVLRFLNRFGFGTLEFLGLLFYLPPELRKKIAEHLSDVYFSKFYISFNRKGDDGKPMLVEYLSSGFGISYNNRHEELRNWPVLDAEKKSVMPTMSLASVGPDLNATTEVDLTVLRHCLMALANLPDELERPGSQKAPFIRINNRYRSFQIGMGVTALAFAISIAHGIDLLSPDKLWRDTQEWSEQSRAWLAAIRQHSFATTAFSTQGRTLPNNGPACDKKRFSHRIRISTRSGVNIRRSANTTSEKLASAGVNTLLLASLPGGRHVQNRQQWTQVCKKGAGGAMIGWIRNDLFVLSPTAGTRHLDRYISGHEDGTVSSDGIRVFVPDSERCNVCNGYLFEARFPENMKTYCRNNGCLTPENRRLVCGQWQDRAARAPKPLPESVASILEQCRQYQ